MEVGSQEKGEELSPNHTGQGWTIPGQLMKLPLSEASATPKSHESLNLRSNKVGLRLAAWWKVKVLVNESCPSFCDSMDCSPPGSFVHGILQARILECMHFLLQGISLTQESNPGLLYCRQILYILSYEGSYCKNRAHLNMRLRIRTPMML